MLIANFSIAFTWLVLFAAFVGLGGILLRPHADGEAFDVEYILNGFWLGWCLVLLVLQLWHLFLPVNVLPLYSVLVIGSVGLWCARKELRRFIRQTTFQPLWIIVLVLGVLGLANLASAPIRAYDAGLYHLSSIRWASAYAIVPGLANLHDRLGFNSSYFLYQAMLDAGFWAQRSHHIASGLLLMAVVSEIAISVHKVLARGAVQSFDLMRIVLLSTLADQCFSQASTTSPDLAMHVISIVLSIRLCRLIFAEQNGRSEWSDITLILLLSAAGSTIKLSFAAMGGLAVIVVLLRAIFCAKQMARGLSDLPSWLGSLMLVLLIIVPWMARNVVMSGYPLYPLPIFPFDVEWRVPSDIITNLNDWIKSWARNPNALPKQVLGSWDWLTPWAASVVRQHKFNVILPLALFVMANLTIALSPHKREFPLASWLLFFAPPLGMLTFWFVAAPEPRYAGATFWCLGAGAVSLACGRSA